MNTKFAISRVLKQDFIVSIVFLVLGLINFFVFGLEGGRYPPRGAILRFQGFSYFFPTGLPLLIISLILMIRFILLSYKCEIAYSAVENDKHQVIFDNTPLLGFMKKQYSINPKEMTTITISAVSNRGYLMFFALMGLYFDFTFKNGSGNLFLPNLQGFPITGSVLLVSGLIAFVCCVYLSIQRNSIRIAFVTPTVDYCIDVSATDFAKQKVSIIKFVENIPCPTREITYFDPLNITDRTNDIQRKMLVILAFAFSGIGFLNIFLIQYPIVILGDVISWLMLYIGIFLIIEFTNRTTINSLDLKENWNITRKKISYVSYLFYILIGWCGLTLIRVIISLFGNYSILRILGALLTHLAILLILLYVIRFIFKNHRE